MAKGIDGMPENLAHGFASTNGGTSGGSGGRSVTVSTGAQLQAAIDSLSTTSAPLTIYVNGNITPANSGVPVISIAGRNNLSIIGVGNSADFDGIGLRISGGSSNIIIQNLRIHDVDTGPRDAIGIEGPSRNIWIDHNELYSSLSANKDYYDGLLDIKRGAEFITISNNYIHDHHKTSLVGYSDADKGARYITYDHNVFENLGSRTPSFRDGEVHIYNNYFHNISTSGINLRMGAVGLIENNVFDNVDNPIVSIDSAEIGYWDLRGNTFNDVSWSRVSAGEASAENGQSTTRYDVPYAYSPQAASTVPVYNLSHAGVGHLDLAADPMTPETGVPATPDPIITDPAPSDGVTPGPITMDPVTPPSDVSRIEGTASSDRLIGTSDQNYIAGLAGHDQISGNDGNDTIDGGDGRDTITGDAGNDLINGNNGNDQLSGGLGSDYLVGGSGSDNLDGGNGNDVLEGGSSQDILLGGGGNDVLDGGSNGDEMRGGTGDDIYVVDSKRDVIIEIIGEGNDTVKISTNYKLGDNTENLILTGDSNISGSGNVLDNIIMGNIGNNLINGGGANDELTGGGGRDTYVFTEGESGYDVITDFLTADDTLSFDGYRAADLTVTDSASGTILHLKNQTILLEGVHFETMTSEWMHFS